MAIFDVRSRRPLPGSFQAQAGVGDLALSLDGSLLAVALQEGGVIQLWDVRRATLRHQPGRASPTFSFSADQRSLVTSFDDRLEAGVARAVCPAGTSAPAGGWPGRSASPTADAFAPPPTARAWWSSTAPRSSKSRRDPAARPSLPCKPQRTGPRPPR